jgi:fatty-acyl-CoA synthase
MQVIDANESIGVEPRRHAPARNAPAAGGAVRELDGGFQGRAQAIVEALAAGRLKPRVIWTIARKSLSSAAPFPMKYPAPQPIAPLRPTQTSLFGNAELSARRHPDKPFLVFYDSPVTFGRLVDEARRVAGFLEQRCGVGRGARVLLCMQNSPPFVVAYYGILRANAVVVPVNPMSLTEDIRHHAEDAGATTLIISQELYDRAAPLCGKFGRLTHVVVAAYSDYLTSPTTLAVPEVVSAPPCDHGGPGVFLWRDILAGNLEPGPLTAAPEDLSVLPYTSGTTGVPRGCMHTHRSAMYTAAATMRWYRIQPDTKLMAVAPFFHVAGMQSGMNGPLLVGATIVLLPRWDRDAAAAYVERYRITTFSAIPTMVQDFLSNPRLADYDLSSLQRISGGGASMPAALALRLEAMGIPYIEGYGLTETMAATHLNPLTRPKRQCLGIPIDGVDSRLIDPMSLRELPRGNAGDVGEIVTHGPQLFEGYWRRPEETAGAFVQIDGRRFLRTGDLARIDEEGYFFMVDRLKRMINAAGFKVWPAEVESVLYGHPDVLEVCIIAAADARRGETVKALVVLRPGAPRRPEPHSIIDWCRRRMAAFKVPTIVEFVESLPKSAAGKISWRTLQERELQSARSP